MCAIFVVINQTISFEALSFIYNLSGDFIGLVGCCIVYAHFKFNGSIAASGNYSC